MVLSDEEFLVLEKFYTSHPLNKSGLWSKIGHKAPFYFPHHSFGDKAIDKLYEYKFLEIHWTDGNDGNTEYKISDTGREAYQQEKKQRDQDSEQQKLADRKLRLDVYNAERVYKSYKITRLFAWTGGITGIVLAYLKLAEALKIWPYYN